jgi:hypothetical protein
LQLDERSMTAISKILFLLNPDPNDQVFLRQLPEKVSRMIA